MQLQQQLTVEQQQATIIAAAVFSDSTVQAVQASQGLVYVSETPSVATINGNAAMAEGSGNATVLVASGVLDLALGRADQAATLFQQAVARDPLHASSFSNLGVAYFAAGKYPEAESAFRKSLEIKPGASYTHNGLALVLVAQGRLDAALEEMRQESNESWRLQGLSIVYSAMNRRAESDATLNQLVKAYADEAPYQIATVHAYRGEIDDAFRWLERARRARDSTLSGIKADPLLRRLVSDPRFGELLWKLRLPP